MNDLALEKLDIDELRALRGRVDVAIREYSVRKRREAQAAAEEAIRVHGFSSLKELMGSRSRGGKHGTKTAAPEPAAVYRHPDDPSKTWSGRGRRPGWVNEALDAGRSLDDLR